MKILIFAHVDQYVDDLSQCKNFNQVQTYFVKKHLLKLGVDVVVQPAAGWLGVKKQTKSTWYNFVQNVDISLLNNYDSILFTGAIPTKKTSPTIMKWLNDNYKGVLAEFNERSKPPSTDLLFFALPASESARCKWIGPLYDGDCLYPEQQYDKLIIHIDHHYPGREDSSEKIKRLIEELPNNKIFQQGWKGYEIYYHSKKINDLENFDFYNPPPNTAFANLSRIYRSTHVGFLSHRETLGMYPFEIAACGGVVAVLDELHLTPAIANIIDVEWGEENFWNRVLPKLTSDLAHVRSQRVSNFSYKHGIARVYDYINTFSTK